MRVAAYCRVSTEKDQQLDSLENQKRFFQEYAEKTGAQLVGLYADEGISGTSLRKREEFLRLMRDAREGRFDTVVAKDISRFARNTVDFLQSIRELKALGINTRFITANMESLGESEFVLTIFGAMAQEESANLSRRVKFGKKLSAERGRVPQRIFGYDRIDNFTLRLNWQEAEIVREIYQLYLEEGMGCRAISLQLNREQRKTKLQCDWNPKGVRRVLTNPIYCGHYVNHKYEVADYLTGKQVPVPIEERFHHERPDWAIVSPGVFQRVQEQIAARRVQYNSGEPQRAARYSTKHLFSTLIKCAHCGRSFCRKRYTYQKTRIYWKCTTNDQLTAEECGNTVKLEEEDLQGALSRYFTSRLFDEEVFASRVLEEVSRRRGVQGASSLDLQKRRRDLQRKKERYQEMYAAEVLTLEELIARTRRIEQDLQSLEERLRCQNRREEREEEQAAQRDREALRRFLRLETMTNVALRVLLDSIRVHSDGTVQVRLHPLNEDGEGLPI